MLLIIGETSCVVMCALVVIFLVVPTRLSFGLTFGCFRVGDMCLFLGVSGLLAALPACVPCAAAVARVRGVGGRAGALRPRALFDWRGRRPRARSAAVRYGHDGRRHGGKSSQT
jgi:hypothetical protein